MIVGLTSGTWDLLHASHLHYLQSCKAQCDRLIVGVDGNTLVKATKGSGRPIHDQVHRLRLINALAVVDIGFILHDLCELMSIASTFNVDRVFKCDRFRNTDGRHIYGTERAELVIIPDVPGMVTTTRVVEEIKRGIKEPILVRESATSRR